ncbi:hypothetical protein LMH87_010168 [Akanthomyces muscarius]|uniref:NACHT domain-containing protein n=1 Tax=Akanthomyces muscarius TaxID=2231603 RepID=A0A9W8QDF6_AKAMU|nr:hypothetical protein LMH87_010168 [Akanthomyces muscarius]KAJ4153692.1 hypothetical protein LMH87_010168 [Akanthomyces muscarius]
MDALAALSLASTLMRFAEYGSKLLSQAPKLYEPAYGSLTDSIDVDVLVRDLLSLKQSLQRQAPTRYAPTKHTTDTQNYKALEALCARCVGAAQDLLAHLTRLKTKPKATKQHLSQKKAQPDKWRSLLGADGLEALDNQQQPAMMEFRAWVGFHTALRAVWNRQEMEALEDSLWHVRKDIQFQMLASIRGAFGQLAGQRSQTSHELKKFATCMLDSFYKSEDAFVSQMQVQSQRLLQLDESDKDDDDDDDPFGISVGDILHGVGSLQTPEHARNCKEPRVTNLRVENELRTVISETCVLESLSFATMVDRRESVEKAHARTFDWIYKDAENAQVPWSNFVDWLRHGDGIYWINGKVGCGKSTLMRYLYENKTTQQELATWAAGRPCEVYSFFFWNSGGEHQKSQLGLLRSLLFDILQRHRSLMRQVMPDVWGMWSARANAALEERLPYDSSFLPPEPETLTVDALSEVFQKVLEHLGKSTKLCFFIDGLDEYGADHSDIIRLTTQCAVIRNVKFCLSSRPLRVFEESFSGLPTLRLQDLTHGDLSHYVLDSLYRHPRMQQLSQPQAAELSHLIQEVVTKSQGVFLWVKLVVRSLVHELPTYGSIADIRHQVYDLPGELDDLYTYIIAQKDYKRAAQILQIFITARKLSPEKVTLLQLSFADEEDESLAEEAPMLKITIDEKASRCQGMNFRLKSICAGLLESHDTKYSSMAPDGKVLFLHRTVSDWIAKPDVWAELLAQTANTSFSPSLALLKSCILHLKGLDVSPARPFDMRIVANAVVYAKDAETEIGAGFPRLFDQLDLAATYQWRLGDCAAVYEVDDLSDTSSNTAEAPSEGRGSPSETPEQLHSYLQSYRASVMASQSGVLGTVNRGTRQSLSRPSRATPAFSQNELAASYMSYKETRFGGTAREEPKDAAPTPQKVGTDHEHWSFCLAIPGLIPMKAATSFYNVASLAGMKYYVATKDASANVLDHDVGHHLLMRTVAPPAAMPDTGIDPERIETLLAGGAGPNFAYQGQTPWEAALAAAASHFVCTQEQDETATTLRYIKGCENWIKVMEAFLRHDADPYAEVKLRDMEDRPIVSLCALLESHMPRFLEHEAFSLMELLLEKRREVDRKQTSRQKKALGIDIEAKTPVSSAEWPNSWIPIRNSVV